MDVVKLKVRWLGTGVTLDSWPPSQTLFWFVTQSFLPNEAENLCNEPKERLQERLLSTKAQ